MTYFFEGIQNSFLKSLPPEIGNLRSLERFDLFACKISFLPVEVGRLENLKVLNLCFTKLNTLPAEIGNLKNLNTIDLGYIYNLFIPEEFTKLNNLKDLRATINRENYEQVFEILEKLKGLVSLQLVIKGMTELPKEIKKLKALKSLSLTENKIETL